MEFRWKLLKLMAAMAVVRCGGAQAQAESAPGLLERWYEYARLAAPRLAALAACAAEREPWACVRARAAGALDGWERALGRQRTSWAEAADREVARAAGRAAAAPAQPPSAVAGELEDSLRSLVDIVQSSLARAMARKKGGGGIDSITLSTSSGGKKKKMKKKKKPQKIQIIQAHPQMMMMMKRKQEKGRQLHDTRRIPVQAWVIGHPESEHDRDDVKVPQKPETHARVVRETDAWTPVATPTGQRTARSGSGVARDVAPKAVALGRGAMQDAWDNVKQISEMLTVDSDEDQFSSAENQLREGEERGKKKKKKKKAILKLLLLGAVAKAKIGLLLQILSAKLQIKFFLIALAGLIINVARFWLDLKKGNQPQKVIYYEHAQHQHHYEHEDEGWGGGGGSYWSRSLDEPKEEQENIYPAIETEHDEPAHAHLPYRAYGPPADRVANRVAR